MIERVRECCANCRYMEMINGFEMVCYKKQKYTFHLNVCEEWRILND